MVRLDPKRRGGGEGEKTPVNPTASQSRRGESGHGREGGDENPTPTQPTQDQALDGGDKEAPRGAKERETTAGAARTDAAAGGAGNPAAHPTSAALAASAGGLIGGDQDR